MKDPLFGTEHFHVVCDVHPFREGHVLIIPKDHLSCIGEYPEEVFAEFVRLYGSVSDFIRTTYGSVGTFEHGRFGQTVFHSHIQMFPFEGNPGAIIPEGEDKLRMMRDFLELKPLLERDGGYLFFSIGTDRWTVDPALTAPRFFRDRFAKAMGKPERGNWRMMRQDESIMADVSEEIARTKERWKSLFRYP